MEPTYFHQPILRLPLPTSACPFSYFPTTSNVLDEWLDANRTDAYRHDVLLAGFLCIRDVPKDQVLCTVILTVIEMTDEIYLDNIYSYGLFLAVDVPSTSCIPAAHLRSPLAAIGSYQGLSTDPHAPAWTSMVPHRHFEFRQPRGAMAEVFAALAFWQENYAIRALCREMLEWAVAIAAGMPAATKELVPVMPEPHYSLVRFGLAPPRGRTDRRNPRYSNAGSSPTPRPHNRYINRI